MAYSMLVKCKPNYGPADGSLATLKVTKMFRKVRSGGQSRMFVIKVHHQCVADCACMGADAQVLGDGSVEPEPCWSTDRLLPEASTHNSALG